jgi:hypothetical protein
MGFRQSSMSEFLSCKRLRNDSHHFAAEAQHLISHDGHDAYARTAKDQPDAAFDHCLREQSGRVV